MLCEDLVHEFGKKRGCTYDNSLFYVLLTLVAALSLSCHSSCKPVFIQVFGTLAKSSISNEASLIPAWLKGFVHFVEANNHLTLISVTRT